MQSQDDKDTGAMLTAYLDNELDEAESRAIERKIESGDVRLATQLAELRAARDQSRHWCSDLTAEVSKIDLWPGLEAKLGAELKESVQTPPLLGMGGLRIGGRKVRARGDFSRGFSWGFSGGLAFAGCASLAVVTILNHQGNIDHMIAGKQMVPLTSVSNQPVALIEPPAVSAVQVAEETETRRGEHSLALVSAGKDVGSAEELAFTGPVFVLPADLFADARDRERPGDRIGGDRYGVDQQLAVQLLSPNKAVPSSIDDFEMMAKLEGAARQNSRTASIPGAFPSAFPTGFEPGVASQAPNAQSTGASVTWVSNPGSSGQVH